VVSRAQRSWGVRVVLVVGALTSIATSPPPTYVREDSGEGRLESGSPRTLTVTISKSARPHSELTLSFYISRTATRELGVELEDSQVRVTPQGAGLEPLHIPLHCSTVRGMPPTEAGVSAQALLGDDDSGSAADDAGLVADGDGGSDPADAAVVFDSGAGAGPSDAGRLPSYASCEGAADYRWEPLAALCTGSGSCTLVFELQLITPRRQSHHANLHYEARVVRSDGGCDETVGDYPKDAFVRAGLDE